MWCSSMPQIEFFRKAPIDKQDEMITAIPRGGTAWSLPSFSSIFMPLNCNLPTEMPSYTHNQLTRRMPEIRALESSKELQQFLSISSSSSESGIMDDPFADSDTSLSTKSSFEVYNIASDEIWDSWFPEIQDNPTLQSPLYPIDPKSRSIIRKQDNFSPFNRNFATPNLSGRNISSSTEPKRLRRSGATRTRRPTIPQPTTTSFPIQSPFSQAQNPTTQPHNNPSETPHNSWPLRNEPRPYPTRPQRSRANTTPAPAPAKSYTNLHHTYNSNSTSNTRRERYNPSSLSNCTMLDGHSNKDVPLYMRSLPGSPIISITSKRVENEQSVFDSFDSDDEDEEKSALRRAFESTLHIRHRGSSSSDGNERDGEREKDREGGSWKRTKERGRKAVKGIFGKKEKEKEGCVG